MDLTEEYRTRLRVRDQKWRVLRLLLEQKAELESRIERASQEAADASDAVSRLERVYLESRR